MRGFRAQSRWCPLTVRFSEICIETAYKNTTLTMFESCIDYERLPVLCISGILAIAVRSLHTSSISSQVCLTCWITRSGMSRLMEISVDVGSAQHFSLINDTPFQVARVVFVGTKGFLRGMMVVKKEEAKRKPHSLNSLLSWSTTMRP